MACDLTWRQVGNTREPLGQNHTRGDPQSSWIIRLHGSGPRAIFHPDNPISANRQNEHARYAAGSGIEAAQPHATLRHFLFFANGVRRSWLYRTLRRRISGRSSLSKRDIGHCNGALVENDSAPHRLGVLTSPLYPCDKQARRSS